MAIGLEGALPPVHVRAVHGRLSPAEALRRMLAGTDLVARPVGPGSFRLTRRPARRDHVRAVSASSRHETQAPPVAPAGDIIVTARKRREALGESPLSLDVVGLSDSDVRHPMPDTGQVAAQADGLALTNLGPGRNRLFVRGVADSPFNGSSQSTVSLEIDEHRATYNAPDPDLRLVDVDRVEILKGPQGPLYGTGALGGIYHVVTRKPDLERSGGATTLTGALGESGTGGGGGSAVLNLPLVEGRLGLRIVGYGEADRGWINTATRLDSNSMGVAGARVTLRYRPLADWTIDLSGVGQWLHVEDSQYVFAAHARRRDTSLTEPHDNDFRMLSGTVHGKLGGADLVAAASYVLHDVNSRLDASAMASVYGLTAPILYDDRQRYRLFDSEIHLSGGSETGFGWLAGLSYLNAIHRSDSAMVGVDGTSLMRVLDWLQRSEEGALFGEFGVPIAPRWRITGGARLSYSTVATERSIVSGVSDKARDKLGFTPSLTLSWRARPALFLYARYASAMRPGGLSPIDTAQRSYRSDELWTAELAGRWTPSRATRVEAALFHTHWHDIQSDYLLDNGLVGTRNVGDGEIEGLDMSADLDLRRWSVRGGALWQRARLTDPASGLGLIADRQLPVVPDVTLRFGLDRKLALGAWSGQAGVGLRYIGSARLSFDSDLDRRMGNYLLVDWAITARRGPWSVGLTLSNATDSRADSFAFGNPFSIRALPQYTPVPPRLARLTLSRRW